MKQFSPFGDFDPDVNVELYLTGGADGAGSDDYAPLPAAPGLSPTFLHNAVVVAAGFLFIGLGAIAGSVWHRKDVGIIAAVLAIGFICVALREAPPADANLRTNETEN